MRGGKVMHKRVLQKLMGLGLLGISVLVVLMACAGKGFEDSDCTVLFFTMPAGLFLLFSRKVWIE